MTRSITTFVAGLAVALALTVTVSAQQTFLSEGFGSATGATPPAGWTTSATGTNPAQWRFDNAGARTFDMPIDTMFAICDADDNGSGTAGQSDLTSPAFDVSSAATVNAAYDTQFRALQSTGDFANFEVFDGVAWNIVASYTANVGYNSPSTTSVASEMYDITAAAGASVNAQVRFSYAYGYDWWWAVDNVLVDEPAAFDLAMVSVDSPNFDSAACFLPSAPSTVTCTFQNAGGAIIPTGTIVPMQLRVDGVNIATENNVLVADLNPGASLQYTFTAQANLVTAGLHDILCRVVLPGDAVTANNGVTRNYDIQISVKTIGWTEDFESHATTAGTTVVPAGWTNDQTDGTGTYPDWRNDQGTTPSSAGPPADHTTGTSTGWYMFIEDSTGTDLSAINLITPCLDTSTAVNPYLTFWHYSDAVIGSTNDNILEIDVIDVTNGNTLTTSVATFPSNGVGSGWVQQAVDLSAFSPSLVKVVFRGRNDNGSSFDDDEAIDDVAFIDFTFDTGQAPQAGLAVFDIDSSVNNLGYGVTSGQPGPYFTNVTQGSTFTMSWEGQPNQPLTSFFAPLNRASATFPGIGQMDCGVGPINMLGFPSDLVAFGNGILWYSTPGAPFGFDTLWITNSVGTGSITMTMPNFGLPSGTALTTFQFGILSPSAPFSYLSNAVEVTVN